MPPRLSPRVLRLSLGLMALVMFVYAVVQVPVALLRSAQLRNPWTLEISSMLLGTFFITLNIPLSWPFAGAVRERRTRWAAIAAWTIAMFALEFVALGAQNLWARTFWPQAMPLTVASLFPVAIVFDSATAFGLLLAVIAIERHDASVRAAVRADHLRAIAREEELRALLAQLHPHFLFNTLNAISALIAVDAEAARSTLAQLRMLIEQHIDSAPPVWTVAEEMRVVSTYLDIEKRRFGENLELALYVDPDANTLPFPRLLLQPLVENAVRHGVRRGGRVSVDIWRSESEVLATVRDMCTAGGNSAPGHGVGLSNVRARLDLMYGGRHDLRIATTESGTTVQLRLPAQA